MKVNQLRATIIETLDAIDLGLLANGGGVKDWHKSACRCDPDVGAMPCEYCAIQRALERSNELLLLLLDD